MGKNKVVNLVIVFTLLLFTSDATFSQLEPNIEPIKIESTKQCSHIVVPYMVQGHNLHVSPCLIPHLNKFFMSAMAEGVSLKRLNGIKFIMHDIDFRPLLGITTVRKDAPSKSYIRLNMLTVGHKNEVVPMAILTHEFWHLLTFSGHTDKHWVLKEGKYINPLQVPLFSETDLTEVLILIKKKQRMDNIKSAIQRIIESITK